VGFGMSLAKPTIGGVVGHFEVVTGLADVVWVNLVKYVYEGSGN
jgi:hypothetical protein